MKKTTKKKDRCGAGENIMAMYLEEISRIPLLSREEEEKIARAAAQGNEAARSRLINGNLRFVVNIAKKYQGHGIPLADLISEGNIGLLLAAKKFDPDRGFRFISYAVWWIRQSIFKALCEKSRLIRLPSNRAVDLLHIEKAKRFLSGNTSYDVEMQEIASILNMDETHVKDMMAISREIISLEKQVSTNAGATSLGCFIEDRRYDAPEQESVNHALEADIDKILSSLDNREADIIRCRFGLGKQKPLSLKEISDRYDISKERVRQIEQNALKRLQHPSRSLRLEAYVA